MTDTAISVSNLSKKYYLYKRPIHRVLETFHPFGHKYHTSFAALSNVDFQVRRGESVGIIGRNGSGKSTLLQIICGNLPATGGHVQVKGRISALLELGAGFNPEFTGRENVYLSTAILGLSRQETDARFGQITGFADIGEFIDRPVKTYSSGMYIRLAFATAISVDPEILIIDEALAVGDIFFQQKCMEHMKKMIHVSHRQFPSEFLRAVTNMCNRVILLDHGHVAYEGAPPEGVAQYTKILHNEQFAKGSDEKKQDRLSDDLVTKIQTVAPDFDEWLMIAREDRGGAGEVEIVRASVTRDELPIANIQQGEKVTLRLLVHSVVAKERMIFGYTIKDRVGNAVFGENSLCLGDSSLSLEKGYSIVEYGFIWPQVYPDNYTLTVGIGEGTHPLTHAVQCWAHNIVSFAAVAPGVAVHGMFNNPLEQVNVMAVGSEVSTS